MIPVKPLQIDSISIEFPDNADDSKILHMKLRGSIDMEQTHNVLLKYFSDIHTAILEHMISTVELDLTELDFMNSSGIGALIKWFVLIPPLPDEKKYTINIHYNPSITWQQKGLRVLTSLSDRINLIKTEVKTKK